MVREIPSWPLGGVVRGSFLSWPLVDPLRGKALAQAGFFPLSSRVEIVFFRRPE